MRRGSFHGAPLMRICTVCRQAMALLMEYMSPILLFLVLYLFLHVDLSGP